MKKMQKLFLIVFVSIVVFGQYLDIPDVTVYGEKEINIIPPKKSTLFFVVKPDSFVLKDKEIEISEGKDIEKYEMKNFGFYTKFSIGSFFDTSLVSFDERFSFFAQKEYLPILFDAFIRRDFKFYDYDVSGNLSFHPYDGHSFFAEYSKLKSDSIEEIFGLNYLFSNRFGDFKIGLFTGNSDIYILSNLNFRFRNYNISFNIFDLFFPDSNFFLSLSYDLNEFSRIGFCFKKYPLPVFTYIIPVNDFYLKGEFSSSRYPFLQNIIISYFEQFFICDKYRISLGYKLLKSGYAAIFMNDSVFHGFSFSIYKPFNFNIYYIFDNKIFINSDMELNLMDRFIFTLLFSYRNGVNVKAEAEFIINEMLSLFIESISSYEIDSYNIRTGLKIRKVF